MWVRHDDTKQLTLRSIDVVPLAKHQGGEGHDQKSHGRWAVGDTISGQTAGNLQQEMLAGGGISITFTGKQPSRGFMVSYEGSEVVVSDADMRDPVKGKAIIRDFIKNNAKRISEGKGRSRSGISTADQPKNYFGAWFNKKTETNPTGDNKWYLDVSENVHTLTEAVTLGRERNQLSVYSVNAEDTVNMDSPLADYAMTREGGNPEGGSWFSSGSGRSRLETPMDAFKAADMEDSDA